MKSHLSVIARVISAPSQHPSSSETASQRKSVCDYPGFINAFCTRAACAAWRIQSCLNFKLALYYRAYFHTAQGAADVDGIVLTGIVVERHLLSIILVYRSHVEPLLLIFQNIDAEFPPPVSFSCSPFRILHATVQHRST